MVKLFAILSFLGGITPLLAATPAPNEAHLLDVIYPVAANGVALENGSLSSNRPARAIYTKAVTAYTSDPEETDDTPFITASGSQVRPGIVAANWLPFGSKVRLPDIYGNQIFTVEDRMHERNSDKLDVWFADKGEAIQFGLKRTRIEVI